MTKILKATTENILLAAEILRAGGLVAFPTETVYGLGANALDEEAVKKIFAAKERPAADPLIVHLAGLEHIEQAAKSAPPLARRLAERFWPGPLTLILPKQPQIPRLVTSGLDTVAVRAPAHPVALSLLRAAGTPIAAPSANRFGHTSPTAARHVWDDLKDRIEIILDGGATPLGVESTVLDISAVPPRILRPGGVTREMLEDEIGKVAVIESSRQVEAGLPSPGLLEKHYAPRAQMIFFKGEEARRAMLARAREALAAGQTVGVLAMDEDAEIFEETGAVVYRLGGGLDSVASRIYDGMRRLDADSVALILCRDAGESGLGLAIRDRLTRAASAVVET
ncbi:MAG: threonylcarbamoyl-AMP synthase [Chloroflexi bacterium]|nr:threonylcarbamoyl-AMP synthase [Chloroflexota bacterium]